MKNLSKKALRAIGTFIMLFACVTAGLILFAIISDGIKGEGWNVSLSGTIAFIIMFGVVALAGYGTKALGREDPATEGIASYNPAEPSNPDNKRWTDRA